VTDQPQPTEEEQELAAGEHQQQEDEMRQAGHADPERARERKDDE
jgi:hypothetical protein